jgi:hypothetical protein
MSMDESLGALADGDLDVLIGVAQKERDEKATGGRVALSRFWAQLLLVLVSERRRRRSAEKRLRPQVDHDLEAEDLEDDSEWTTEPPAA